MHLKVIELHQPKRGFILSPRRRMVERSLALSACFRCLARYHEQLARSFTRFLWLNFA